MLEKLIFNELNEKLLCEIGGKNADMNMTIFVKKLTKGSVFGITDSKCETAYLLLKGTLVFKWYGNVELAQRTNAFEKKPYCLHVPKNVKVEIEACSDCEFIVQQAENDTIFEPVFYKPEDVLYQEFGVGQWNGAGHRVVSTIFDYDNAPYSKMILGEVFNKPGCWSSYPPHHHPQPEVYYYQFNPEQGFGACFNGETAYKSEHGDACFIHDGEDHQQATAPGYDMYYVWMIRHIDNDPWYKTTRFTAPEHEWLLKDDYSK